MKWPQLRHFREESYVLKITPGFDTLRENCPYLEFFWSVFPRIWTEYGEIFLTDKENSEYGQFLRSDNV